MVLFTVAALTAAKAASTIYYVSKDEKECIHSWPRLSRRSAPMLRSKRNKKHEIGDGSSDSFSQEEVAAKALEIWGPKDSEEWKKIEQHRPYYLENHKSNAPKEGDTAPDGEVLLIGGGEDTLHKMIERLAEATESENVAVFFVSASCPSTRFQAPLFQKAAKESGLPILFVVIMEAHACDEFPSPVNETWPYALREQIERHKTREDRERAGTKLRAHLTQMSPNHEGVVDETVPIVLDTMSNVLELKYEARPMRFYVVNAATKKVKLATGLAPFNIPAKLEKIKDKFQPAEDEKGEDEFQPAEDEKGEDKVAEDEKGEDKVGEDEQDQLASVVDENSKEVKIETSGENGGEKTIQPAPSPKKMTKIEDAPKPVPTDSITSTPLNHGQIAA